jgi:hypothetical protein
VRDNDREAGAQARVALAPEAVERFLGPDEAAGGPFALLGVSPAACTDELVLSALDRQVEKITRHPECDTPEADEVRLALHAAAAQLLDPVVRRHLIARWTGVKVAIPPPGTATAPRRTGAGTSLASSTRLLEADAILALGLYGGWNQRSLRRLVSLAHARGFTTTQVAETLRNLGGRRRRAAPKPAPPVARVRPMRTVPSAQSAGQPVAAPVREFRGLPPDEPRVERARPMNAPNAEEEDPARRLLRNAVIFGGVGLLALFGAAVLILVLTMPPGRAKTVPPPQGGGSTGPAAATSPVGRAGTSGREPTLPESTPRTKQAAASKLPPKPADVSDLAALVREIAACAESVQSEPEEATARFERAVERLSGVWTEVPRDRLIASHDSIVEFVYKASGSAEMTARAVGAIARGAATMGASTLSAEQIKPAVWSVGMLSRLARERDLSAAAKAGVESQLAVGLGAARGAVETTFESGAAAALYEIPARLTPPAEGGKLPQIDMEAVEELGGRDPGCSCRGWKAADAAPARGARDAPDSRPGAQCQQGLCGSDHQPGLAADVAGGG